MKLYLLRHAIAADDDPAKYPDDGQRPLTEAGQKKMAKIARGLDKMELQVNLILSSPLLRARQTAEVAQKGLHLKKDQLVLTELLSPSFDPKKLVAEIQAKYKVNALLLVGHEPDMSNLISLLLSGDISLSITMKKAGICCLSVDALVAGKCATLEWLFNPGQRVLLKEAGMTS